MPILIHSSDLSIAVLQESSCKWDLTLPPSDNSLDSGGVVTWLQDYDFYVSPAEYHINGVPYSSPEAYITLSPSDPTLDRFDVIYVDADQVVKVLEGEPSLTPSQPGLDLGLQLGLGVVFVEAGSTVPTRISQECIYQENGEWTAIASDGSIDVASANTPCIGGVGVEATNASNGDYLLLDRGTSFAPMATFNVITFRLKAKAGWNIDPAIHSLKLRFRIAGVQVGNVVTVGNGLYNFNALDTATCQIISIPTSDFNIPVTAIVDQFQITVSSTSGDIGFFIDGLCLQGGIYAQVPDDDIHNQYFGAQTPGRFWIRTDGRADGWFTSPQRIGASEIFYTGSEKYGWASQANAIEATAIGYLATVVSGQGGVAIGSQAISNGGIAIKGSESGGGGSNVTVGGVITGSGNTAIGAIATITGSASIALGENAKVLGGSSGSSAIGYFANVIGTNSMAFGNFTSITHDNSIVMGGKAASTATNQFILGGTDGFTNFGIKQAYIGTGVTSVITDNVLLTITGASGTDIAGKTFTQAGAKGTGAGLSGPIEWQTSDVLSTGSTLQSLTTKMALNSNTKGLYLDNVRFQMDEGANVVASNDLTLGTGNFFSVSGNTPINAITSTNWQDGAVIYLLFTGTPTVKHNTAGGAGTSPIRLAGAVDFSVTSNTVLELGLKDGYWREVGRTQASAIGPYTFFNGLHEELGGLVKWGGTLVENTTINGVNTYGTLFDNNEFFQVNTDADVNLYSDGGANYSWIQLDNTAPGIPMRIETASTNMTSSIVHNNTSSVLALTSNKSISLNSSIRTTVDGRFEEDKGANVVAANDLTLGLDGNLFIIPGNTQINAITTANWQAGSTIKLEFTGTPTIKNNTAGGGGTAPILLAGGVDYIAAANDVLTLVYDGTNWHETARKSTAVGGTGILSADNGLRLSSATNVQWGGPVGSAPALLFNTYIDTSTKNITIGTGMTTNATASNAFSIGKNHTINASTDLNFAFQNNHTLSGNENVAFGRNHIVAGSTNAIFGADSTHASTANYAFLCGDANDNAAIASMTMGFGNDAFVENGFTGGSDNDNGAVANVHSNTFVYGLQNTSLGSRNFIGGQLLTGTGNNITMFGTNYSSSTASTFNVGYGSLAFEISALKVRTNLARFEEAKGSITASANNLTLPNDGNLVPITGAVQINAITTLNWQAGSTVKLEFSSTPTVKHNTAGGAGTAPILLSGAIDYVAAADDVLTLVYDGTSWHETARKSTAVGSTGIVSADNGLTLSTATNVQLGGSLLHDTNITSATSLWRLNISGVTAALDGAVLNVSTTGVGGAAIKGTATDGRAIWASTSGNGAVAMYADEAGASITGIGAYAASLAGVGIYGKSRDYVAAQFISQPASTNTVIPVVQVIRSSTTIGANGIGGSIEFNTRTDAGLEKLSNQLISKWTVAADATRTSQFILTGVNSSVVADLFTVSGNGETRANKYGVGSFTSGTGTYLIATKADGTLMEFPTGGLPGGGALITADNGMTATSATNVQLGSSSVGASASPLLHNTFINTTSSYRLEVNGNNTDILAGSLMAVNSGNGTAFYATSYGGANAATNAHTMRVDGYFTSTNTVEPVLQVARSTSAGADGIGAAIEFRTTTAVNGNNSLNSRTAWLAAKWVNESANYSQFEIYSKNNGSLQNIASFYGTGVVGIGISSGYDASRLHIVDNSTTTQLVKITTTNTATGLYVSTTSGNSVFGVATTGVGGQFNNSTGGTSGALQSFSQGGISSIFTSSFSSTNTVEDVASIGRGTTGTGANGIGGAFRFNVSTNTTAYIQSNQLISKWTDATHATRTSQLDITGVGTASTNTIMSAHGSGVVGIGIASSYTATRLNVVDNSVAGASIVNITSSSTAATGNAQIGLSVALSGANANGSQTTYGIAGYNQHSGTGATQNIGVYGASINGSNNYGVLGTDGTSMSFAPSAAGVAGSGAGYGVYGVTTGSTSAAGVWGVNVHASSGIGVLGQANSSGGLGIYGASLAGIGVFSTTDTGVSMRAALNPVAATPSAMRTAIEIFAGTSSITNVPGNGYGGQILWTMVTNNGGNTASRTAASIDTSWTDVTDASRTALMTFTVTNAAVNNTVLTITGAGIFTLSQGLGNYANDGAAAAGGIPVNGLYRNGSVVMIRVA
jgi:hypothetical protein